MEEKSICLSCGGFYPRGEIIKRKCVWCSISKRTFPSDIIKRMITRENIKNLSWSYKGKIIATFTLLLSEGVEIPDMRMMDGRNGYFISGPSVKIGREWRHVVVLSGEVKQDLLDILIEAQDDLLKRKSKEKRKNRSPFPYPEKSERREKEEEYLEWKKRNSPYLR